VYEFTQTQSACAASQSKITTNQNALTFSDGAWPLEYIGTVMLPVWVFAMRQRCGNAYNVFTCESAGLNFQVLYTEARMHVSLGSAA
jgi:hypothetical protein